MLDAVNTEYFKLFMFVNTEWIKKSPHALVIQRLPQIAWYIDSLLYNADHILAQGD